MEIYACICAADAAGIASAFSPAFELAAPDVAVFEAGSLRRLYRNWRELAGAIGARAGKDAGIAIARDPDSAILLARNTIGITIAPGDPAPLLAPLAVECLALVPGLLETLDMWGIHTVGELACLPESGLAARFGEAGVHLRRLARGEVRRPLEIHRPPEEYRGRIELDHPVALLEPLTFVFARILNELCARLQANGMAADEIHFALEHEDKSVHRRTLRLPVAIRESQPLLKLLWMDLEAHPPPSPSCAVSLALVPVSPRRVQNGLFLPPTPDPAKLELTLARIRGWVGEENAGIPRLLDTHRPEPFEMLAHRQPSLAPSLSAPASPCLAFRYFRPPLAAEVRLCEDRPVRIAAGEIRGQVTTVAGPWLTSGGWWTASAWDRREWDVALPDGGLYRIYQEAGGRWFIEGMYD